MRTARIFISHSWKYDDYDNLVNLLDGRGHFEFQQSSVPSSNPLSGSDRAVWEAIYNKIRWCQVMLLTAGVHASYSGSIKREMDFAKSINKPVIAVIPHQPGQISTLRNHADEVVHWRADSIVAAIRNYI